jgi:glycosyltransferase involved in cell wall biosynthesis
MLAARVGSAGGVESYLRRLRDGLSARGHELLVVAGHRAAAPGPAAPGECEVVPGFNRFGASREKADRVLQLAADFSPDVVHVHEMNNYPLALALAGRWPTIKHSHMDQNCAAGGRRFFRRARRACGRRLGPLCLWHYYAAPCGPGIDPRQALWGYRRASGAAAAWSRVSRILVNSDCLRRLYVAAGIPERLIDVLHYFVPEAEESVRTDGDADTPTVIFVGRLVPEKGLNDALRALVRVPGNARLVVVGDGPDRAPAEKLAAALGTSPRVEFAGWQRDVEPFYSRASLLVVPSLWPEPFGIVGIEAMARALPVVAYRSGGIPEWLEDEVSGLLVEPGDVGGLAAAIGQLTSDPARAREMGRSGQERQRRLFGPDRHLTRLESFYRELAAR